MIHYALRSRRRQHRKQESAHEGLRSLGTGVAKTEGDMTAVTLTSACAILAAAGVNAFVPQGHSLLKNSYSQAGLRQQEQSAVCRPMRMSLDDASESRGGFLKDSSAGLVAGAIAVATSTGASSPASAATVSAWEQIQLPVASVLYDIAFDPEHPDHGLVVGAQGTFLEVRLCGLSAMCVARVLLAVLQGETAAIVVLTRIWAFCVGKSNMYHHGRKYSDRLVINMNFKRSLNLRSAWY